MSELDVRVDGVALGDPGGKWWVSDDTEEPTHPSMVVNALPAFAGGVGERDAPSPGHGAALWQLVVTYVGHDYADVQLHRAVLESTLLARHRPVTVQLAMSGWRREARAVVVSGQADRLSRGRRVDVTYTLRVPSGRWTDVTATAVELAPALRVSGTASDGTYLLSPLAGGSRDMDPVITFTAAGVTDVTVKDVESGQWVRFAGDVTGQVVVDPVALTATVDGVSAAGALDFSPRTMHLSPPAVLQLVRNADQPVTVTARRSY